MARVPAERGAALIPVHQTAFGPEHGNCVQAAWASVLEVPITEIPDFSPVGKPKGMTQLAAEQAFAEGYGLMLVKRPGADLPPGLERTLHFGYGRSPRDLSHRVVMRGVNMVHDPHPEGAGVKLKGRIFLVSVVEDPVSATRPPRAAWPR